MKSEKQLRDEIAACEEQLVKLRAELRVVQAKPESVELAKLTDLELAEQKAAARESARAARGTDEYEKHYAEFQKLSDALAVRRARERIGATEVQPAAEVRAARVQR